MNITKTDKSVLLKNSMGEYHFSVEDYDNMSKEAAITIATEEIKKKHNLGMYQNTTINFQQARELGFCEYGIKDFCERLKLDLEKDHTISELYNSLDVHTFKEYPDECLKLFSNTVFDKFGGVSSFLDENRTRRSLNLIIHHGNINDNILHTLAYKSAMRVIVNFEKVYPNDDRPRKAIEAKKLFIEGKITAEELSAAWAAAGAAESAAWAAAGAAESAAWAAARAAESAAWAAARAAAESAGAAAESAAESAGAAAWAAELTFQIDTLITLLK